MDDVMDKITFLQLHVSHRMKFVVLTTAWARLIKFINSEQISFLVPDINSEILNQNSCLLGMFVLKSKVSKEEDLGVNWCEINSWCSSISNRVNALKKWKSMCTLLINSSESRGKLFELLEGKRKEIKLVPVICTY
jgi:hypothetical protein